MTLVIPHGKKTGCLPRESRPGQWAPLAADRIDIIPRGDWPALLDDSGRTLRPLVNKIKDQNGVGSCATESTAQSIEIMRAMSGQEWVQLNPWFIYQTTSGGSDRGSSIDANLRFVTERGCAPESIWPRSNGWRTRPSAEAIEAAKKYRIEEWWDCQTVEEIGSALLTGFPVVFGWSGHSTVMTRLVSTNVAEYANSWGASWGDSGFGQVRLSQVNWNYGAYIPRVPTMLGD